MSTTADRCPKCRSNVDSWATMCLRCGGPLKPRAAPAVPAAPAVLHQAAIDEEYNARIWRKWLGYCLLVLLPFIIWFKPVVKPVYVDVRELATMRMDHAKSLPGFNSTTSLWNQPAIDDSAHGVHTRIRYDIYPNTGALTPSPAWIQVRFSTGYDSPDELLHACGAPCYEKDLTYADLAHTSIVLRNPALRGSAITEVYLQLNPNTLKWDQLTALTAIQPF